MFAELIAVGSLIVMTIAVIALVVLLMGSCSHSQPVEPMSDRSVTDNNLSKIMIGY